MAQKEKGVIRKRKWFGIENRGRINKKIKRVLGKVGVTTYRKGGKRVLDLVRNKKKVALKEKNKDECVQCSVYELWGNVHMRYGKEIQERLKEHKDDVRLERD